jgi:hypothetical protein
MSSVSEPVIVSSPVNPFPESVAAAKIPKPCIRDRPDAPAHKWLKLNRDGSRDPRCITIPNEAVTLNNIIPLANHHRVRNCLRRGDDHIKYTHEFAVDMT